jgi:hypothetical protein
LYQIKGNSKHEQEKGAIFRLFSFQIDRKMSSVGAEHDLLDLFFP